MLEMTIAITSRDITLGGRLVTRLISSVESAGSNTELVDIARLALDCFAKLANSVTSAQVIKALSQFGPALHRKISEVASAAVPAQSIFTDVVTELVEAFRGVSESRLTVSGGLALLAVAEGLLMQQKHAVVFSADVCKLLVSLVHPLAPKTDLFNKRSSEIFKFIASLSGFTPEFF